MQRLIQNFGNIVRIPSTRKNELTMSLTKIHAISIFARKVKQKMRTSLSIFQLG